MPTTKKPKRTHTTATKAKPKRKRKPKASSPEVLYPEIHVEYCFGDQALTDEKAKELLGWQECKQDPLLKDNEGNKIRCCHNMSNRPFYIKLCNQYVQEILRKKWKSNCQNRIIGKTGTVISGQHALIALVLANQIWEEDKKRYSLWKTKPTMDTLIAFGCEEDDETVDTVDTGKPRTIGDTLYRSDVFGKVSPLTKKVLSRDLGAAIRFLWYRTGVREALNLTQTHSESREFLENHKRLVECVKHINDENNKNSIAGIIKPGVAAAMMYLMASCESDDNEYVEEGRTEDTLDWSCWDDASDFFVHLGNRTKEMKGLITAYSNLSIELAPHNLTLGQQHKTILIALAWDEYLTHKKVTNGSIKLKHEITEEGTSIILDYPSVGGIDKGEERDEVHVDPTPEEIEEREEEIRTEKKKPKTTKPKSKIVNKPKRKPKPKALKVGNRVKVSEEEMGGDGWEATLTELYNEFGVVTDDEGNKHEVAVAVLSPA